MFENGLDREALDKVLCHKCWTNAKTYEKIAPHEYILQPREPEIYTIMKELIQKHGVKEPFTIGKTTTYWTYLYIGEHKYWIDGIVLNRVKIKGEKKL